MKRETNILIIYYIIYMYINIKNRIKADNCVRVLVSREDHTLVPSAHETVPTAQCRVYSHAGSLQAPCVHCSLCV